ncbi:LacI family DNA-binding transcriptional regulator [Brachybacterium sp. FME24]|uniref:LacI family DNA-binding transcriptional regulator n=1 Tax=Brachybacterium sp. FME24 TaxID=2742605 RepID=UPI0018693983|nr:LacI family DNA-binding transcriptional regulator [Brachybacterium sp. FME24]
MKRATIYSIASIVGVSPSTVSRTFSRPEMVKVELRERILATARELGYAPNRAARGLATGRSGVIGMLVPDVENPFFPPLIRAVQAAARVEDAELLLIDSELSASAEQELVDRIRPQVDGLIIASPRLPSKQLHEVVRGVPTVAVNRAIRSLPAVVCDNTSALEEIADHLHQLGHRRIALLRGPQAAWAATHRARAVRNWADDKGVELVELGPFEAQFADGRDAAAQIVESGASAVFAFDDLMAAGVIAGLSALGESVPRDRSIVGCDDVLLAQTMTPSLTTVTAPFAELGSSAVEMLSELIAGRSPRTVTLSGTAVLRGTIGPAVG